MNEDNLKGFGFDKRTASERREIAVAGGKASGVSRRRKADFRKTLNLLLTAKIDDPEWTPVLESLGLDSTLEAAVNAAMIKRALSGNVSAYEAIARYSGQSEQTDADQEEQRIRTARAKNARDQEMGRGEESTDGIRSFLQAMRPTEQEMADLFAEEDKDGQDKEETGSV